MEHNYFTQKETQSIKKLERYAIEGVYYTFWENNSKKDAIYECLDYLELKLSDGTMLCFTAGEESDALRLVEDFDFEKENELLKERFQNQVKLYRSEVTTSDTWVGAVSSDLKEIRFSIDENGNYLNIGFGLQYTDFMIAIGLGEEGIYVELYEQDDEEIESDKIE